MLNITKSLDKKWPKFFFFKKSYCPFLYVYFILLFAYKKNPQLGKNASQHASSLTQFLTSLDYIATQ